MKRPKRKIKWKWKIKKVVLLPPSQQDLDLARAYGGKAKPWTKKVWTTSKKNKTQEINKVQSQDDKLSWKVSAKPSNMILPSLGLHEEDDI